VMSPKLALEAQAEALGLTVVLDGRPPHAT
jgi:hypothetical protein